MNRRNFFALAVVTAPVTHDSIKDMLFEGFKNMDEATQKRTVVLGLNAEYVLRQTAGAEAGITNVDKAVVIIRNALRLGL